MIYKFTSQLTNQKEIQYSKDKLLKPNKIGFPYCKHQIEDHDAMANVQNCTKTMEVWWVFHSAWLVQRKDWFLEVFRYSTIWIGLKCPIILSFWNLVEDWKEDWFRHQVLPFFWESVWVKTWLPQFPLGIWTLMCSQHHLFEPPTKFAHSLSCQSK